MYRSSGANRMFVVESSSCACAFRALFCGVHAYTRSLGFPEDCCASGLGPWRFVSEEELAELAEAREALRTKASRPGEAEAGRANTTGDESLVHIPRYSPNPFLIDSGPVGVNIRSD